MKKLKYFSFYVTIHGRKDADFLRHACMSEGNLHPYKVCFLHEEGKPRSGDETRQGVPSE